MNEYNKPIPVKYWEAFLTFKGCNFIRQKSGHHHWKCPGCLRTITFWGDKKEIPRMHIRSNLKTLRISNNEFNQWIKENC